MKLIACDFCRFNKGLVCLQIRQVADVALAKDSEPLLSIRFGGTCVSRNLPPKIPEWPSLDPHLSALLPGSHNGGYYLEDGLQTLDRKTLL